MAAGDGVQRESRRSGTGKVLLLLTAAHTMTVSMEQEQQRSTFSCCSRTSHSLTGALFETAEGSCPHPCIDSEPIRLDFGVASSAIRSRPHPTLPFQDAPIYAKKSRPQKLDMLTNPDRATSPANYQARTDHSVADPKFPRATT